MLRYSSVYQNRVIFFLCILKKNRKVSLLLCSTLIVLLLVVFLSPRAPNGHIIVISATYYNTSTLYRPHTIALLFNAEKTMSENQKWTCISKNSNGIIWKSDIHPQKAYQEIPNCKWTTFIANCSVIQNPISFQISVAEERAVELPFRYAVTKKYPIVACFSPLFFNERWQLVALSIESYVAMGVSNQAYYLMSAVKDVNDLLKFYESANLIDINLWTLPKHAEARIQLDWRNQAAAHTDCFLKYREAAEFIIISDIDDLLIPRNSFNLLRELQFYSFIYPNISSFFYPRIDAEITAAKSFKKFDIQKSIESIVISDRQVTGKSVHRTSIVETAWIHWAGLTKGVSTRLNMADSIFVHMRNWNFVDDYTNISLSTNFISNSNLLFPNITSLAPKHFISRLINNFNQRINNNKTHNLHYIKSSEIYYEKINKCYDDMQDSIKEHYKHHKETVKLCPTPSQCKFRSIPNLSCAVAKSSFKTVPLTEIFSVEFLKSPLEVKIRKNGCKIN